MEYKENIYSVTISNIYQGPMDLLLDLIKKNKIDIYDIPISTISEQFIVEMGQMNFQNIDIYLDFSLMAATLLHIKSKMLLPKSEDDEEEEDPRNDLVNKLIEYNYFKSVSERLEDLFQVGSLKITKNPEDMTFLSTEKQIYYKEMNISSILNVFSKLMSKIEYEEKDFEFDIEMRYITVEESLHYLEERLKDNSSFYFSSLKDLFKSKVDIITYFLTILELIKENKIKVRQEEIYEDLLIEKNE